MRLLFVSGTTGGGSGRSQRELAGQLISRGHDVLFLVDDKRRAPATRWLYGHLSDLSVRVGRTRVAPLVVGARDRLGTAVERKQLAGVPHWVSVLPQNAFRRAVREFNPDVVVVNSIERWAWRLVHASCQAMGLPTVLYVREEDSLRHLETEAIPDVLVANTLSLAKNLRAKGLDCSFIPSVVDTSVTRTESTRRVALAINPIPAKGGDIVWAIARRLPGIPFVMQESWPLTGNDLARVEAEAAALPNVEFRRSMPPGPALYGDARVLLVPYRVDSRPRVILEAQSNGIPVVAGDTPALADAVGAGGLVVPLEDVDAWADAVRSLWGDEGLYHRLSDQAAGHSQRSDVEPGAVADQFGTLVASAVTAVGSSLTCSDEGTVADGEEPRRNSWGSDKGDGEW